MTPEMLEQMAAADAQIEAIFQKFVRYDCYRTECKILGVPCLSFAEWDAPIIDPEPDAVIESRP